MDTPELRSSVSESLPAKGSLVVTAATGERGAVQAEIAETARPEQPSEHSRAAVTTLLEEIEFLAFHHAALKHDPDRIHECRELEARITACRTGEAAGCAALLPAHPDLLLTIDSHLAEGASRYRQFQQQVLEGVLFAPDGTGLLSGGGFDVLRTLTDQELIIARQAIGGLGRQHQPRDPLAQALDAGLTWIDARAQGDFTTMAVIELHSRAQVGEARGAALIRFLTDLPDTHGIETTTLRSAYEVRYGHTLDTLLRELPRSSAELSEFGGPATILNIPDHERAYIGSLLDGGDRRVEEYAYLLGVRGGAPDLVGLEQFAATQGEEELQKLTEQLAVLTAQHLSQREEEARTHLANPRLTNLCAIHTELQAAYLARQGGSPSPEHDEQHAAAARRYSELLAELIAAEPHPARLASALDPALENTQRLYTPLTPQELALRNLLHAQAVAAGIDPHALLRESVTIAREVEQSRFHHVQQLQTLPPEELLTYLSSIHPAAREQVCSLYFTTVGTTLNRVLEREFGKNSLQVQTAQLLQRGVDDTALVYRLILAAEESEEEFLELFESIDPADRRRFLLAGMHAARTVAAPRAFRSAESPADLLDRLLSGQNRRLGMALLENAPARVSAVRCMMAFEKGEGLAAAELVFMECGEEGGRERLEQAFRAEYRMSLSELLSRHARSLSQPMVRAIECAADGAPEAVAVALVRHHLGYGRGSIEKPEEIWSILANLPLEARLRLNQNFDQFITEDERQTLLRALRREGVELQHPPAITLAEFIAVRLRGEERRIALRMFEREAPSRWDLVQFALNSSPRNEQLFTVLVSHQLQDPAATHTIISELREGYQVYRSTLTAAERRRTPAEFEDWALKHLEGENLRAFQLALSRPGMVRSSKDLERIAELDSAGVADNIADIGLWAFGAGGQYEQNIAAARTALRHTQENPTDEAAQRELAAALATLSSVRGSYLQVKEVVTEAGVTVVAVGAAVVVTVSTGGVGLVGSMAIAGGVGFGSRVVAYSVLSGSAPNQERLGRYARAAAFDALSVGLARGTTAFGNQVAGKVGLDLTTRTGQISAAGISGSVAGGSHAAVMSFSRAVTSGDFSWQQLGTDTLSGVVLGAGFSATVSALTPQSSLLNTHSSRRTELEGVSANGPLRIDTGNTSYRQWDLTRDGVGFKVQEILRYTPRSEIPAVLLGALQSPPSRTTPQLPSHHPNLPAPPRELEPLHARPLLRPAVRSQEKAEGDEQEDLLTEATSPPRNDTAQAPHEAPRSADVLRPTPQLGEEGQKTLRSTVLPASPGVALVRPPRTIQVMRVRDYLPYLQGPARLRHLHYAALPPVLFEGALEIHLLAEPLEQDEATTQSETLRRGSLLALPPASEHESGKPPPAVPPPPLDPISHAPQSEGIERSAEPIQSQGEPGRTGRGKSRARARRGVAPELRTTPQVVVQPPVKIETPISKPSVGVLSREYPNSAAPPLAFEDALRKRAARPQGEEKSRVDLTTSGVALFRDENLIEGARYEQLHGSVERASTERAEGTRGISNPLPSPNLQMLTTPTSDRTVAAHNRAVNEGGYQGDTLGQSTPVRAVSVEREQVFIPLPLPAHLSVSSSESVRFERSREEQQRAVLEVSIPSLASPRSGGNVETGASERLPDLALYETNFGRIVDQGSAPSGRVPVASAGQGASTLPHTNAPTVTPLEAQPEVHNRNGATSAKTPPSEVRTSDPVTPLLSRDEITSKHSSAATAPAVPHETIPAPSQSSHTPREGRNVAESGAAQAQPAPLQTSAGEAGLRGTVPVQPNGATQVHTEVHRGSRRELPAEGNRERRGSEGTAPTPQNPARTGRPEKETTVPPPSRHAEQPRSERSYRVDTDRKGDSSRRLTPASRAPDHTTPVLRDTLPSHLSAEKLRQSGADLRRRLAESPELEQLYKERNVLRSEVRKLLQGALHTAGRSSEERKRLSTLRGELRVLQEEITRQIRKTSQELSPLPLRHPSAPREKTERRRIQRRNTETDLHERVLIAARTLSTAAVSRRLPRR